MLKTRYCIVSEELTGTKRDYLMPVRNKHEFFSFCNDTGKREQARNTEGWDTLFDIFEETFSLFRIRNIEDYDFTDPRNR